MTATLSQSARNLLHTFEIVRRPRYRDNLVSLADLRFAWNDNGNFERLLTELRRANLLVLSSADRYLSDADRAAGISEHGEILTHVSRVQ